MTLDPRRPVDDLRLLSDRLRAIEDRLDRLAAPSGTQALRSVAKLIDQQALLAQMRTYSATSGTALQTGPGTTLYTDPPAVTFTVDRPMQVLLQLGMPIEYAIGGVLAAQAFASYALTGPGASGALENLWDMSTPSGARGRSVGFSAGTGVVGAGTHVFSGAPYVALFNTPGATDFVRGYSMTAIVSVIGEQ